MIRVVIADDSATARELLRSILEHESEIQVIAEAADGHEAVRLTEALAPDLILMDVHMPIANGLAATKEIMSRMPTPILIVSAVTQRDVDLSLSATQAGALMALPKPAGPSSRTFAEDAETLRAMVRAMAQVKVVRRWSSAPTVERPSTTAVRSRSPQRPKLIALAASTGGPGAFQEVLGALPASLPVPVLLVQHIARDFTAGFADWLAGGSALPVKVAEHGEPLRAGVVYVAPDDRHLGVTPDGLAHLDTGSAIGGFRPSATYLFESAAQAYGPELLAAVMTGMGSDGARGLELAHALGAYVLAQDETTSVVFGMAQEAVRLGAVDLIVPLPEIAPRLLERLGKEDHAD